MDKRLFNKFDIRSKESWLLKIQKDLKGRSIDELDIEISQHEKVSPFAHAEDILDSSLNYNRKKDNHWNITERIIVEDYAQSNSQALLCLEQGVSSLVFEFKRTPSSAELQKLFKHIRLDFISMHLVFDKNIPLIFLQEYCQYLENESYDISSLKGSITSRAFNVENAHQTLNFVSSHLPLYFTLLQTLNKGDQLSVDEEISDILSLLHHQIEALLDLGIEIKSLRNRLFFSISGGLDYFTEISKIRALRILVDLYFSAYSDEAFSAIHIEYKLADSTIHENADYNKIQATTQAMAAIIGGVDDLCLTGSNFNDNREKYLEDRRIYNNIQHILMMESYLDKVVDPASGSYYIETLTDTIAASAWNLFKNKVKK